MVLVRFNHDAQTELERWRVLHKGVEYLASNVQFSCPTNTSKDIVTLPDGTETTKWHICADKYKAVLREVRPNGDVTFLIK